MKKIAFTVILSIATVFIFMSASDEVQTSGAPIGSTGAPNELTCAKSGCHDDKNNLNTGKATINLETNVQDFLTLLSGDTVHMVVNIQEDSIFRFGFSLTILDQDGNSCGEFLVTEPLRTQKMQGYARYSNRQYMTYTRIGTNPYSNGTGLWRFSWLMPDPKPAFVDIYLATVAANNDGTDKGDRVYTMHTRWQFNNSKINNQPLRISQQQNELIIYAQQRLNDTKVHAYDNMGNRKATISLPNTPETEIRFNISTWPNGQYHLVVENNQKFNTTKIIVNR